MVIDGDMDVVETEAVAFHGFTAAVDPPAASLGGYSRVASRTAAANNAWLQLRTAAPKLRRLLTLGLTSKQGSWGNA